MHQTPGILLWIQIYPEDSKVTTAQNNITVSHDPEQGSSMSRYRPLAVADSCCIEILKSTTVRQLLSLHSHLRACEYSPDNDNKK